MSLIQIHLSLPETQPFSLSQRLKKNMKIIQSAGFSIVEQTFYPFTKHPYQTLAKYVCSFSHWRVIIKDLMDPEIHNGILGLYEIEDILTGETYKVFCNLKGGQLDANRLAELKKAMSQGVKFYLQDLQKPFITLVNYLQQKGFQIVRNDLELFLQSSSGMIAFSQNEHVLFCKMIEDENGVLCLSISNSENWVNPSQNRLSVEGKLFPIFSSESILNDCMEYIENFFKELETGTLSSSIPTHLYEKSYL